MPRPTECRYCGEKTIVEDNSRNLVFKCGTAMWDNGANLAGHKCRNNCLYQAAELRERINEITKERDELIESRRLADVQIERLIEELAQAYDERNEAWKERDEAIEKERCLTSELKAKQKMWDTHCGQLNAIQEELNGELAEARKQIDQLEKGIHQSRCHIQNMADYYEKGD